MGKLEGKIALITGGSDGIGLATAELFIAEGAYVFITGRRKEALDAAVKQLGGKNVTAIQADSAKLTDLDNVMKVIQEEKGKLDILLANAAIVISEPLQAVSEKSFDAIFNVNVKGVLFTVQKALPIFADGGSIILCGSNVSISGTPGFTVYAATKAAIRSFARCWTVDLKDRKIRVNTLSPGPTDTPMFRSADQADEKAKQGVKSMIAKSPAGRVGQPSEITRAAVFLASDDSSYVTGTELFVDGGLSQI